ncbi:hypothetical protein [Ammoniphilus sp. YIM 78166]|nr:hypothetical protein [Ammoniphilus sp. YIM 78166]
MEDQKRLQELIEKGKKTALNNKELMEMISLLGPEEAMRAVKGK